MLYTLLIKRRDEDEIEALYNNVLSEVRDHSRWLSLTDGVRGHCRVVALGEKREEMKGDEDKEACHIGRIFF